MGKSKWVVYLLLLFSLAFILTTCGGSGGGGSSGEGDGSTPEAAGVWDSSQWDNATWGS